MRTTYSHEFKNEVIRLFKAGESGESLIKRYSLPESTLYRWTHNYRQSITVNGRKLYRADIAELMRQNEKLKLESELLHKSRCAVQAPLSEKLPEMIRLKEEMQCDVHTLCRAFEVLRSTYYHRVLRSPEKTQFQHEDETLKPIIKEIFEDSKERFGSLMIKTKIDALGFQVSPKRISRLMQEMGLRCNSSKRTLPEYKRTYFKSIYYTPNRLNRKFLQLEPNCAWVSDITYLRTLEGTYFLCVIIDLFSRRVIGHCISKDSDTGILVSSLDRALSSRMIKPSLIFHSDQGCQYISREFRSKLEEHGIIQSLSNAGSPYDNAVAESFFASLKKDELYKHIYKNLEEVSAAVEEYIIFFNTHRPHYTLGMLTPQQIEEQHYAALKEE